MKLENYLFRSDELLSITDFDVLYEKIMNMLSTSMNIEASSIVIKSDSDDSLYFFYALGLTAKKLEKITIPYGRGIVSYVIKTKKSMIENNPSASGYFYKDVDIRTGFETKNILAVPLIGKTFIGALELINKFDRDFSKMDLSVAQFFAKFIVSIIENLKYRKKLEEENISLKNQFSARYKFSDIIYKSSTMQKVVDLAKKVADTDSNILILGESGTGKEMIAQAIHNFSHNKRPFIAINCAAIPAPLLESEMFGYEKGAFTGADTKKLGKFELAAGGTILLDEIAEMPLLLQAKLLRVIQEREINRVGGGAPIKIKVRIISATNQDLVLLVKNKRFREDLFYRINVVPIFLPPLRERKEDIVPLFKFFLKKFDKKKITVGKQLLNKLENYRWSGNIRELENFTKRYVLFGEPDTFFNLGNNDKKFEVAEDMPLEDAVRRYKKYYITRILMKCGNNQTEASRILNLQRTYLNRLIKKLGG